MNRIILWIKNKYIKYKLYKHLNSGKLILVSKKFRGVGKSTLLCEISTKYDIPLIVSCKARALYLQRQGVEAYSCQHLEELRGKRFHNGVLIDERVEMDKYWELRVQGIRIRTGFYYNNCFA